MLYSNLAIDFLYISQARYIDQKGMENIMSNKNLENDDEMYVTLTLDDDSEVECIVITIFEAGDRDYIALLPTSAAETEEGEVYLYRYAEDTDGNPELTSIESDDEYEIVADRFDEWLDEQEYNEMVGDDE